MPDGQFDPQIGEAQSSHGDVADRLGRAVVSGTMLYQEAIDSMMEHSIRDKRFLENERHAMAWLSGVEAPDYTRLAEFAAMQTDSGQTTQRFERLLLEQFQTAIAAASLTESQSTPLPDDAREMHGLREKTAVPGYLQGMPAQDLRERLKDLGKQWTDAVLKAEYQADVLASRQDELYKQANSSLAMAIVRASTAGPTASPNAAPDETRVSETQSPVRTDPGHPWEEPLQRLREAMDQHDLGQGWPSVGERVSRLLDEAEAGANLDDVWFRTRIAYAVFDVDRIAGNTLPLAPEVRSEIDRLAVAMPGLQNDEIAENLRLTGELGRDDLSLIHDIRQQARRYVEYGQDEAKGVSPESISAMAERVTSRLAGPDAPAHTEVPPHLEEGPVEAKTPAPKASAPEEAQAAAPKLQPAAPVQQVPSASQGQPAKQTAGGSWTSAVVDAVAAKPAAGRPPWEGLQQALAGRMASYKQAHADGVSESLHKRAQSAAEAAVEALKKIETGPAADLLRRVNEEAATHPLGLSGVISNMRPGGTHESLRNEMNTLFAENKTFATAYDRAKLAVQNYLESRSALRENYERRGWNPADLDGKMQDFDRAIVDKAERVPGRNSGQSLIEDLAERAMKMARDLIDRIKQTFGSPTPEAAAAPKAPSMAPSI